MTTYTGTPKPTHQRWMLVAACSAALAVGTVAGLGAWQIGLHGQGKVRVAAPPQHLETAVQRSNAPTIVVR